MKKILIANFCRKSEVSLHKRYERYIEYEIIGEGSQISTNQKRESTVSWLLIGRNLRPFPDNFVLYSLKKHSDTKKKQSTSMI